MLRVASNAGQASDGLFLWLGVLAFLVLAAIAFWRSR